MRAGHVLCGLMLLLNFMACVPRTVPREPKPIFYKKDLILVKTAADTSARDLPKDSSGDGVSRRKVIYRDLSASFKAVNQAGKVAVKICVNQQGIVTYAQILPEESTITNKRSLENYLYAALNYRVEADKTAPPVQCGKLTFKVSNDKYSKLKSN